MKKLLTLTLFLFLAAQIFAQVNISAEVDKNVAEVNERLTLTVRVTGARGSMAAPELPSIPNFNYYESSSSMQSYNMDFAMVFTYTLIPRFAGKAEIAPIKYSSDGKDYFSEPIVIHVFRKGEIPANFKPDPPKPARPQPSQPQGSVTIQKTAAEIAPKDDVLLRAEVSKQEAYVGEQITLNIELWNAANLTSAPLYYPPEISGMTSESMGETPEQVTRLGSKSYARAGVSTALFGATAGKAKIGPARVSYSAQRAGVVSPFDVFFATPSTKGSAQTSPIEITIKPLPEGKGKYFYNAVGSKFTLKAQADRTDIEAGEAATVTFTLKGVGNLKTISQPKFETPSNTKSYDMQGETNMLHSKGVMYGTKTFKLVIVPNESGHLALAPQNFTYFDTEAKKYITLHTDTIWFNVSPSSTGSVSAFDFASQVQGGGVKNLGRDINYIKENISPGIDLLSMADAGKYNYAPFILLALALLLRVFIKVKPQRSAIRTALLAINKAQTPDHVANALEDYILAKTKISLKSNKIKTVTAALISKHKADSHAAAKFEGLWNGLDAIKFSPVKIKDGSDITPLKNRALTILQTLDKGLK